MNPIESYFPKLTERQKEQFKLLANSCREWNEKINVISRKDIDNLEINHILHSLSIAKFIEFKPGTEIIDLGTGGGFPGLPLAILFPDVKFHLVDRIAKKIKVAEEMAKACGLENVTFQQGDFGECKKKADFIVSRAVMPQSELVKIGRKNIKKENSNALPNGIISLKGGDLQEEIKKVGSPTESVDVTNYFDIPFFNTKKILYTQI